MEEKGRWKINKQKYLFNRRKEGCFCFLPNKTGMLHQNRKPVKAVVMEECHQPISGTVFITTIINPLCSQHCPSLLGNADGTFRSPGVDPRTPSKWKQVRKNMNASAASVSCKRMEWGTIGEFLGNFSPWHLPSPLSPARHVQPDGCRVLQC